MVCARGLRDKSLESKDERPSGVSSSSSLLSLEGPFEEDLGVSPDLFVEGDLAELAPLSLR